MSNKKSNDFYQNYLERKQTPFYDFVNLEPTARLEFELLDDINYKEVFELFKEDDNPFVLEDYKNLEELDKYKNYILKDSRFSSKRGGCDWLVKLKQTNIYIGIINLYDMSRETFNDNHKKCMIGFNTNNAFRRKYYTSEAVQQLKKHIYEHFGRNKIIANVDKKNTASKKFLEKLGFKENTKAYYYSDLYDYFEFYWDEIV